MKIKLNKCEREQVEVVAQELGHDDFEIEQRSRHKMVRWSGGCVTLNGTPSDHARFLKNLRADIRRRVRSKRPPGFPVALAN